MSNSNRSEPVSRRTLIHSGIASLGVLMWGQAAFASGGDGGGGGGLNAPSKPKAKTKKKAKKKNKVSVKYTQRNFHKIKKKDLETAIRGINEGHEIWVEGFSKKMSKLLFKTALTDQGFVAYQLKIMSKKKTKKERIASLQLQRDSLSRAIEDAQERSSQILPWEVFIQDKDNDDIARVKKLRVLRNFLYGWRYSPMEGTLDN